jgi:hypothetical protein
LFIYERAHLGPTGLYLQLGTKPTNGSTEYVDWSEQVKKIPWGKLLASDVNKTFTVMGFNEQNKSVKFKIVVGDGQITSITEV